MPIALREASNIMPQTTSIDAAEFPLINDFKEFYVYVYVYGDEIHANLIGRALSPEKNIVWGTGTHTSTPVPVPVYAFGPYGVTQQFSTMQHHAELEQKMMTALLPE